MKRMPRRLSLSRTTLTQLDARKLAAANGGVMETGCVSGCPGGCPGGGGSLFGSCWDCPQPEKDNTIL